MTTWIILYLAVGCATFGVLWKYFSINWKFEDSSTQILMIITPVAWPLVLLLIIGVYLKK